MSLKILIKIGASAAVAIPAVIKFRFGCLDKHGTKDCGRYREIQREHDDPDDSLVERFLVQNGSAAVPDLVQLLKSPNAVVRLAALCSLHNIGGPVAPACADIAAS